MRSTFNILFYVNKSKEKNGVVPVMGRVTINGTQSQFSCKKSIPLDMWDVKGRSNFVRFAQQRTVPKVEARRLCRLTVSWITSRRRSSSTTSIYQTARLS